jgi:hypothetical protein
MVSFLILKMNIIPSFLKLIFVLNNIFILIFYFNRYFILFYIGNKNH